MKQFTTLLLSAFVCLSSLATIPKGYYNNAIGKHDEALMSALETIIRPHTELSYDFLWTAFDSTDMGSDGYYIDMYSNCKYNNQSNHPSGCSHVGEGLNREHSFPKSWYDSQTPTYTDLHMLIPVDGFVNQRRSNHPYGVCNGSDAVTYTYGDLTMLGRLGTSTYNGYSEKVYEPDDEYKGDFARIYFYIVTCYKSNVSSWPNDVTGQLDKANGYKAFSSWSIQMLMEWHRADPVSAKEISRNEAVYSEQSNRNPFVDHPELAEYIWGTKQNTSWTGQDGPVDPINKLEPEMYPVDETTVTGTSFRANWSNGGDVSSYNLKVNRIATGDETATLLMSEGFSKVNVNSDQNIDIGSSLDDYTDNPGWTGYKLYQAANHSLKVGTSSAIGYLVSPELDLDNTVTVVFNAKNWIGSAGSDNSSVIVSCGDVSQTIALTDTPEDYTVVLNGCSADKIKFSMTANKKRCYIYHVDIYNGDLTMNPPTMREIVEEGDSTWRNISGITDTCYQVQALAKGIYEYMVKAVYTDGDESDWSNIQHVTLTGEGDDVGDVNGDQTVNMDDLTALINYLLTGNTEFIDPDGADLDNSTEVNMDDLTILINILLTEH